MLNPSAFFLAFYFLYLIAVVVLDCISTILLDTPLLRVNIDIGTYVVALLYFLVFYLGAYVIAPLVWRYSLTRFNMSTHQDMSRLRVMLVSLVLIFVATMIHGYYFSKIGVIPALSEHVATLRVEAKSGFGGVLLLATGMYYSSFLLVAVSFSSLGALGKVVSTILLFVSVLVVAGVGFRGPAAYLLLMFVLTVYFQSEAYVWKQRISFFVVLFGFLLLMLVAVLDFLRYGSGFGFAALLQVFWTLTVNLLNLDLIVSNTEFGEIYWGSTFVTDLAVALPGIDSKFLGVHLVELYELEFEGEGLTVTAPGEAFVNFWYPGVVIHAFMLGFLFETANQWLRKKNCASSLAVLVCWCFFASKVVAAGIMPTLIFFFVPISIFLFPAIWICKFR